MKKFILFLAGMVIIPCGLTFVFSLFSDEIQIGKGGNSIENHRLGKEVLIEINGLYKSMDVEEYVLGVLCGTIPADYNMEALKVQAVLIRTNILKEMQEKNTEDAADLSYHYLTVEERIGMWGERNYENYEKRMEKAVVQTAGKVLEQEGALIMALYHEVSIGKTASAKEILDEDISYLQSVDSSQDVEAKHYMNIITYTWEELGNRVGAASQGAEVQEADYDGDGGEIAGNEGQENEGTDGKENMVSVNGQIAVRIEESTENGFVKQLSVNGRIYTGKEAVQIFGLSSANFYVEEVDGGIRFVCLGKGDCLGVSQYGANCMALTGKKMEEIIQYYYKNVSIADYGN